MHSVHYFSFIVFIIYITSEATKDCSLSKSCIGTKFNDSNVAQAQYVQGYKAASGPTTEYVGSQHLYCEGAYACSSMELIQLQSIGMFDRSVSCDGSNSCTNTTLQIGHRASTGYCYGYNACAGSNIHFRSGILKFECTGYRSCANANIYGMSELYARGSLSLYRAVINTTGVRTHNVNITLGAAYAAYGAHLICGEEHRCEVHCRSISACNNFYIDCVDNCDVFAPNIPNNNLPITELSDFHQILYGHHIFADFAGAIVEINADILCPSDAPYDSLYTSERNLAANITLKMDDEGPICCRAYQSCSSYAYNDTTTIIKYETQKKTDLICSGSYACYGSHISNINDTVFCTGYKSCGASTIRYIDYVYCAGVHSCGAHWRTDIIGARYIKCDGSYSCRYATVTSGGVDLFLYFNGYESGRDTNIHCDKTDICTINCIGFMSCYGTKVFCDADLENCVINCNVGIVGACPALISGDDTNVVMTVVVVFAIILPVFLCCYLLYRRYSKPTKQQYFAEAYDDQKDIELPATEAHDNQNDTEEIPVVAEDDDT